MAGTPAGAGRRDLPSAPPSPPSDKYCKGARTPSLAGEGYEVIVTAVVTPGPGKAVRKDAALQIFAKGLADIGFWREVVALPVKLACTGEFMLGLKVFGNRLIEQRALRVARVVEFGFAG